jgi:hypothetical protein
VIAGLLAVREALRLVIHLTRPLHRGMFGSAGVLTRAAGCSEARHGQFPDTPSCLSQSSCTPHSLTWKPKCSVLVMRHVVRAPTLQRQSPPHSSAGEQHASAYGA